MNVGGTLYDVTFREGTCIALFDGCDEASDFTFTTRSDADAASQALLDQVFVNVLGLGNFDTDPEFTFGIESTTQGFAYTPYCANCFPVPGSYNAASHAYNEHASADRIGFGVLLVLLTDTTQEPTQVFADWTVAAVPIPAGGMLLLSALGGMAALRRRMKSTV
ncbi:MAG: VPLPA-CTERM sorting domain-containing protein [Roseobacter sp.]